MSDIELLQKCIKDLGMINIPAALLEQIGIPIFNIRQNLISLCNSVETAMSAVDPGTKQTKAQEAEDGVEEIPAE